MGEQVEPPAYQLGHEMRSPLVAVKVKANNGNVRLKAVQVDGDLQIVSSAEVKFDADLPEFGTSGGANPGSLKNEFYAQPVMWVKALDLVLERLLASGADLSTIVAISGSAQQHGSVYWSQCGIRKLQELRPIDSLHLQLDESAFTVNETPIWMDGSTTTQCLEMEMTVGSRSKMVGITGSKSYPRFTGAQIRKIYQTNKNAYDNTQRISLVSSFLASLFLGNVAPIDYSDGSGMNLLDIRSKAWSEECLKACAPDLGRRLGTPVDTLSVLGSISPYYTQRFGFSSDCKIVACTGDNPSALSGMLVEDNWLSISLGTSDTVMMDLAHPTNLEEGHVLCHPTDRNAYMGLLCFRNGSLVRDAMNRNVAGGSWDRFNEMLESTPRGNFGNIALHFSEQEIIPKAKGILRWAKENDADTAGAANGVPSFPSPEIEVRALIEGQMLHHRTVAEDMGFHFGADTKIVATGGASVNKCILQIISDVFNAPVYIQRISEAALMGAAYRAKYALYLEDMLQSSDRQPILHYHDYISNLIPKSLEEVCKPRQGSDAVYEPMLKRYRAMAQILEKAHL